MPVATLNATNDATRKFAAVFVRATVIGTAGGVTLSVGSDSPGTDMTALAVPAGNGVGANANLSAFGSKKTVIYNGGMEASISIDVSQDAGVTFSEVGSFTGKTPASFNLEASVNLMRVRVGGFVIGTGVISVCAVQETAGGTNASVSPGTGTRFRIFVRPAGNDTTGAGTLTNPYLTIPRALIDVPNIIRGGDRYVIDVSDYPTYDLLGGTLVIPTAHYSLDPSVGLIGPDYDPFTIEAPITIQAVPLPTQTILASDVVSVTAIDGFGTQRMVTTLALTPGALVGMFLELGGSAFTGVIYDNTATDVFFVGAPGISDYEVVRPSTTITNGSIQMSNVRCAVQFNGLGLAVNGLIEKSVAPGFLMSANSSGAWVFEDNDGRLEWNQAYLGTSYTHKGYGQVLYFTATNSQIAGSVINVNGGSSGQIKIQLATLWLPTIEQLPVGPVASLALSFMMLDCDGGGLWLRGGDNSIESMYCLGGVGPATPAMRLIGGRTVVTNVRGTGQPIGNYTGPYGVLAPIAGSDGDGFGGGMLVDALTDVPGATADLQIGSRPGRTWANFRGVAPIGIDSDVGANVGQTQCYIRQP